MQVLQMGTLHGPLLLFGGPYSNLEATKALIRVGRELGITPQNAICTGDVVAYGARPNETCEAIRDWGALVVMGNCEESLGWGREDCGCGFAEGTTCDLLSGGWYGYADKVLSDDHRQWMKTLPRMVKFEYQGSSFAVIHGGVQQLNQFLFPSDPWVAKQAEIQAASLSHPLQGIICGHSGIPFTQLHEGQLWHNAGVIGLPANDGTDRVWYSLWQPEGERIRIEHRSLTYNSPQEQWQMEQLGLNGYSTTITSGLWPSMDVLPYAEKCQQGVPLEELTYLF